MQIQDAMDHIARFRPTVVMLEAPFGSTVIASRYRAYLAGQYTLGPNEVYQFGFRLARIAGAQSVFPSTRRLVSHSILIR